MDSAAQFLDSAQVAIGLLPAAFLFIERIDDATTCVPGKVVEGSDEPVARKSLRIAAPFTRQLTKAHDFVGDREGRGEEQHEEQRHFS